MPECCAPKPRRVEAPKRSLSAAYLAIIYSSCCWLPLLLDSLSLGAASATFLRPLQQLKPVLLTVTILLSIDALRQRGITRWTLLRSIIPLLLLLLPKLPLMLKASLTQSIIDAFSRAILLSGRIHRAAQKSRLLGKVNARLYQETFSGASGRYYSHGGDPRTEVPSLFDQNFWRCSHTWRRARMNTLRCLAGCTFGDFSTMWYLQSQFPETNTLAIMSVSMTAGIITLITLETLLLHFGIDGLRWKVAARTVTGMSMISMLAMEVAENTIDLALTEGVVEVASIRFWSASLIAMAAGFIAPLPWNYVRLKRIHPTVARFSESQDWPCGRLAHHAKGCR